MRSYVLILIALLVWPFQPRAQALMFTVPKDATRAQHAVIQPSIAEQDYFWLNATYPSEVAMDHYSQLFSKWTVCKTGQSGWDSFGDLSGKEPKFIHRRTKHWASPRNDQAVTVVLEYKSPGAADRIRPDTDEQFVVVLRHKARDAKALLKQIGATCG